MKTNFGTLSIIDLATGVDYSRDFILNASDRKDFIIDEKVELYFCKKADYRWWDKMIKKQTVINHLIFDIDNQELTQAIFCALDCELEDQPYWIIKNLKNALQDGEVLENFQIAQETAENYFDMVLQAELELQKIK